MKLAKLSIKNFLSISEAEIEPGKVTLICGANNQGKTSILKALQVAAQGSTDGTLVKRGEDEAEIIVEYDDQTIVHRRIKSDGSQKVTVKRAGFATSKPQSFLDGLFGTGAFNPLDLLDPKRRSEVLLSAIPIRVTEEQLKEVLAKSPIDPPPVDLTQHGLKVADQVNKILYARRAEANKDLKKREDELEYRKSSLPEMPVANDSRSVDEIRKANEELNLEIHKEFDKTKLQNAQEQAIHEFEIQMERTSRERNQVDMEIIELETVLKHKRQKSSELHEKTTEQRARHAEMRNEEKVAGPDATRIEQLNSVIQQNLDEIALRSEIQTVRQIHDSVKQDEQKLKTVRDFAKRLDDVVKATGAPFKAKLMSEAALPIEGLSFEDDEFYLNGSRLEHLSTSATMRLAIAVARSVAGPSKLICLDGAEALDPDTYALLRSEIESDGFQYFITKVGESFASREGDKVVGIESGAVMEGA